MKTQKRSAMGLYLPNWTARLYIMLAIFLIPWIILLAYTLPSHHIDPHWDTSWTGLDIGEFFTLLITGILTLRRSKWAIISLTCLATLLLADAWFDITSDRGGFQLFISLFEAFVIEIPLSLLSFYLAGELLNQKNLK